MKFFITAIILFIVSLTACKKTQTINNLSDTDTAYGVLSAVIDGQQWVASDSAKSASLLNGILNISGTSSDGQTITISLTDTIPGTYMLNENSISIATYTDIEDNSSLQSRYLSTNNSLPGSVV